MLEVWDTQDPPNTDLDRVATLANLAGYFLSFQNPDRRLPVMYYSKPTPNYAYWERIKEICGAIILDSVY